MIGVNEKTSGHIVGPDGAIINLPATLLGAGAAAILRQYFFWAMSNALEPELFCGDCYNQSRESKAQYNIDEKQIQIICACRMIVFMGGSLPPEPVGASKTAPGTALGGAADVQLSEDAARLLRLYKKQVLEPYNLKEAIRCNACYELGNLDGCDAQVTSSLIRIVCRCSDRRYAGLTI